MRYYLKCETKQEYNEILSTLNYYDFKVKTIEKFDANNPCNAFIVDADDMRAKFTHALTEEKFTSLYEFENILLIEQKKVL